MVSFQAWKPWYEEIRGAFGYSLEADSRAAQLLNELLEDYDMEIALRRARELLSDKQVVIFGAGPNLEDHLEAYLRAVSGLKDPDITVISADGATHALLERGLLPDIITTDLDGYINSILEANEMGSLVIIHAHGDNMEALRRYARSFKNGLTLGTCQTRPVGSLLNFGGFTDGDRAVFMALHLGASRILLAGWSFGGLIGRFSKPGLERPVEASPVKRMKLSFAKKLISWLATLYPRKIFVLEEDIPNTVRLDKGELKIFLLGCEE